MPDCAGEAIPCQAASRRIQLAMDETYVNAKGVWKYLYRAVDKAGATAASAKGTAYADVGFGDVSRCAGMAGKGRVRPRVYRGLG